MERWEKIDGFPDYSVSNLGNIRSDKSGRIIALWENQFGVVCVGMMYDGEQKHRSVPLLVANAFLPVAPEAFDTPINLDGDRWNNHVDNLLWRPRWFAVKYNRQFKEDYNTNYHIDGPIMDLDTGEISKNSFECAKRYGLLEKDIVLAIVNGTHVWPTYQYFQYVGG